MLVGRAGTRRGEIAGYEIGAVGLLERVDRSSRGSKRLRARRRIDGDEERTWQLGILPRKQRVSAGRESGDAAQIDLFADGWAGRADVGIIGRDTGISRDYRVDV